MKIVLVFPPFFFKSIYNMPPLGLMNLATILIRAGHSVSILDFALDIRKGRLALSSDIYSRCADKILEFRPDIVGFSVQCTTYPSAINISRELKLRYPDIPVILGGHNASFVDTRTLLLHPSVDVIVRGEGERTFPELAQAIQNCTTLHDVAGITWREESRDIIRNEERELIPHLDVIPLADYSLVAPLSEYRDACDLRRSIAILEVGRGCPHRCVYCSQSLMWRRQSRTFSVDRLVTEMAVLQESHGAECFLLAYDQFTARREFVIEFCNKVIDSDLDRCPWYCISRLDSVDRELLQLMRRAGCESMCYGIDSGSDRTLKYIRKSINRDQLFEKVYETTKAGITPTLSYVIGFPCEEKKDLDETLTLALRTGALGNVNCLVQMATVLPGTELYRRNIDVLRRNVDTYFSIGIEFNEGKRLDQDEKLINEDRVLFSSFYNLPCPALGAEELNLISSFFPVMASSYPRSFLLLGLELESSVTELFLKFLAFVRESEDKGEMSLSAHECLFYLPRFAELNIKEHGPRRLGHLPEIIQYERLALEAENCSGQKSDFSIPIQPIEKIRPFASPEVFSQRFTFNIPDIILDLNSGIYDLSYPPCDSIIVFIHDGTSLHVHEINEFGLKLLEYCNGNSTIEQISASLFAFFGEGMTPIQFFEGCVEAVQTLEQLKLLRAGRSESDHEGR